jgi:YD repeat-containing protein
VDSGADELQFPNILKEEEARMLQSYRAVPVFSPALCLFCALLLFPFFFCNQANATAVGSIQGSISVSPSGAGRYSVPLVIPPGIGAMQPELSLEYDSRSGNGLLGVGWSLGGLSSIRRCPATLAQDGFIDPVDYDNNDRFCLDGQRLIEAGTTGCAGGTEFRTEIDSYARICSFGVRGSGPASFRVWTKSGQVIDYGTSTDSRVDVAGRLDLAAWAINRISDTVGNAVRYVYTGNKNDGSHKLTRIRYAENLQAGMNAVTAIELRYEQRPDAETGYAGAVRTTIAERLSSVVVRVAGKTVSRYRLEYAASAVSGRSMLSRITHCDAVNKCAEPLELGWQTGEQLLKYSGQGSGGTHAYWDRVVDDSTYKGRSFTGDFNGDGRTDLMMVYRDPNLDEVSIYHWHADASGKLVYAGRGVGGTHAWWNKVIDSDKYRGHSFTGDYNGDGRTDLVMIYRDPGLDRVSIYHWHADESGKLYYAGKGSGGTHAYWNTVVDSGKFKGRVFSGDFNGDGRTDLTMVYRDPNRDQVSIYHWHAGTNGKLAYAGKGSGGTHAYWNQVLDSDTYRGQTFSGDFNADGQTDLVMVYRDPKLDQVSIHHWHADKKGKLYYAGKGVGGTHAYWDRVVGSGKFKGKTFVGDFNGDGQSDLMMIYRDPNLDQVSIYHWHAMENGRLGYAGKGIGAVHAYWNKVIDSDTYQGRAFTGDFNGDGKTDLSMVYRDPNLSTVSVWHWQAQPTGKLKYVGRGSGGESARWHQVVDSGKYRGKAHVGDFNGDGKSDLMLVYRDPGQSRVAIHHWGMNRRKTDLLVSIDRHNTGKVEKFSYGFLTDAALYSKAGDAKYPEIDLQIALPVVKTMQVSDGIGGLRTSEYLYQGLKADQHGRGLLGFRKSSVVDRQSDIVTSTSYHQSFPLTGRRKTSDSRLEGAARPFSKTAWTWRKVPLNSGSRYEVQAVSAVESSYEVDGSLVSTVNTEYQAYGKFGNVLRMAVTTSANGNSYTTNTVNYFAKEDPSAWVLGRLTRSEVTSSTPGDSGTRTSDFDYDVVTGLLTSEVIEPDNPDLKLRTEYGYDDGYGNRTSIVERGSGNARYRVRRRISTTAHDYADLLAGGNTYKVVSTNTRGHTGTRVYDLRFGVVRSHIGINGLTTSWNYDGFGRRIRERRADGTETTWQRAWCSSACPSRAVYKIVSRSSGSPTVTRYFDMLDRQVRVKTGGFQGRAILHDTEYDKLGRISRESRNYFDGDPRFWTKYRYDELGRVLRVSSPDGGVEEIDYQGLVTVVRKFDRNGDYDQSVTRKTNALGEEIKVIDPAGQALSKHYDAFGNLVKTVDAAGNSTLLRYDLRGNRISMDDPDMGYWRYRYDALGQLRWQKDALGQVVEMEYDLLGRLVRRTEPEGLASWSYDTAENGLGKLHRVTAEDGYERVLSYDAMGRKFSDRRRMNGSWYEMRTRYDRLGRPNKLVYPGGFRLKYGYDNKGYLVSAVNDRLPDEVFWKAGDFDADGNVVLASLGNGLQTVRLYEPFSGRVRGISTGRGASSDIQFATYRFDSLGNLRKRVDQNRKRTEEFSYDERNRLVNAAVAGVESSGYVYDDLGNIKRKGLLSGYRYGEGGAGPHALTRAG